MTARTQTIDDIRANFDLLDEWDDRYRYVIELGKTLAPMQRNATQRCKQGPRLRQSGLARCRRQ